MEQGKSTQSADALLQDFRNKVTRNIVWAGAITELLLSVAQLWLGNLLQAAIILIVGIVFTLIAYKYRAQRIPNIWRMVFMAMLTVVCVMSTKVNGTLGVYWFYPVLVACFFMYRDKSAIGLAATVTVIFSLASFAYMPLDDAWRIMATLVVILSLGTVFVIMLSRMQALLRKLVITDTLTGLQNRHQLGAVLTDLIHKQQRYQRPATIILIDLDHFKQLNDQHGHLFGDQMLKQVAQRLKQSIRVNDLLFRVGGEEFMVVLPETRLAEAQVVAEKLRTKVADQVFDGKDAQVNLTLSAGVAQLVAQQSWAEWINSADTALLEAKRKGRNRVCLAETGSH